MVDVNVDLRGTVGPQLGADGSRFLPRQAKTGELVVQTAHGPFYEAASRGKLFHATIGAAGVAPGTALSTAPALAVWNPTNSGILVAIKKVFVGYISGTLGAGSLVHSYVPAGSQPAAPTGGTELTPINSLLNGAKGVARAFTGSTIAATSALLRPSLSLGAALASSVAFPVMAQDDVDGAIVLSAGAVWAYQGIAAAGTSPLVTIGVVYEEITTP